MSKAAVYSWNLSPDLKTALEKAARGKRASVADLLERIVREWLARTSVDEDEEVQRRLHASAAACFGTIAGGDPDRTTKARETLRSRLDRRRERPA